MIVTIFLIKRTVFVLIVKNVIHTKKMLRKKIVRFKKIYKFYIKHFLIGLTFFLINMKMSLNSRELKFFKEL